MGFPILRRKKRRKRSRRRRRRKRCASYIKEKEERKKDECGKIRGNASHIKIQACMINRLVPLITNPRMHNAGKADRMNKTSACAGPYSAAHRYYIRQKVNTVASRHSILLCVGRGRGAWEACGVPRAGVFRGSGG